MKKFLLATTALAATASVAAAEVSVSGSGRMGLVYVEDMTAAPDAGDNEIAFTSRVRVLFTMSGETDGGLAFGGEFGAHDSGPASAGTAGKVFISGAFGKLSMGDVGGAAESVVGDLDGVGLTGIGDFNENLYLSNSGATRRSAALYEYVTGGLTFALSADNPKNDTVTNAAGNRVAGDGASGVISAGVKYTTGAYTFSLGYETADLANAGGPEIGVDHIIVGAAATFGAVTVKATYGEADTTAAGYAIMSTAARGVAGGTDFKQMGLSATYAVDALSLTAYHRVEDWGVPGKLKATGIGASYDLGGGASAVGGISTNKFGNGASQTQADVGISFKF